MVQYCSASLYLAKIPGNRYVNGIVFGVGEVFAMVFSSFLMSRLLDTTAFRVIYFIGLAGYMILIFCAESVWLPYLGILMLITSVGGWFNTTLLILELRVPPQNVGSVSAIIRTMAVGAAVVAPTVSNLPSPWPMVSLASFAGFAFILTLFLPPPGQHLASQAQKTGEHSVVLVDKLSNGTLAVPMDNMQ
mmetsp:Transcript_15714/g.19756  ORF Transcript_15714/g.19756 Transcript_15714/m.19756 type:complete len:190 (-) Transcript_15714:288-857(-)